MIGYIDQRNNNITVYFENNEIENLPTQKIQGTYINLNQPEATGLLETVIADEPCEKNSELISTDLKKNEEGLVTWLFLRIRQDIYARFKEKGSYSLHQGFRHINLLDTNRLNAFWEMDYELLKDYKPET